MWGFAHPIAVPRGWPVVAAWAEPVRELGDRSETLSPAERARSLRLRRDADRARFETGRMLARELLGRQLGVAPGDVPLAVLPAVGSAAPPSGGGRPVVGGAAGETLRLSIAHAADRVLVAVGDGVGVGVDVEPVGGDPIREVWPSVCTAEELEATGCGAPGEAIVALWTRKEAVLKACGRGLTVPMTAVSLGGEHGARVVATAAPLPAAERFELADLDVGAGYRAALAVLRL